MSNEIERLYRRIKQLENERKICDKRIRAQRRALRDNWEIVEQRGHWMGSPASRRYAMYWRKRCKELEHVLAKLDK